MQKAGFLTTRLIWALSWIKPVWWEASGQGVRAFGCNAEGCRLESHSDQDWKTLTAHQAMNGYLPIVGGKETFTCHSQDNKGVLLLPLWPLGSGTPVFTIYICIIVLSQKLIVLTCSGWQCRVLWLWDFRTWGALFEPRSEKTGLRVFRPGPT